MSTPPQILAWFYMDNLGAKVGLVEPGTAPSDPDLERLAHQLDRLPRMLREARAEGDALAINWLETLQQAVRTSKCP